MDTPGYRFDRKISDFKTNFNIEKLKKGKMMIKYLIKILYILESGDKEYRFIMFSYRVLIYGP